jgi:hypothetical protein
LGPADAAALPTRARRRAGGELAAGPLQGRDWAAAQRSLLSSAPFDFVVLDNFLDDALRRALHGELVQHWGWRQKNPLSPHLHNDKPKLAAIPLIAEALRAAMPTVIGDLDLVFWWAIMYHRNRGGTAHSDHGAVTLNLWLTPDVCNLDPGSGGLVLLDVKRTPDMAVHEFSAPPFCVDYVERHTRGGRRVVPYRCNRAVVFDATTFHHPQAMSFDPTSAWTYRMGLTMTFDRLDVVRRRLAPYFADDPEAAFREVQP